MGVLGTMALAVLPSSLCPLQKGEELLSFVLIWDKNGQILMVLVEQKIWPNQGMVPSPAGITSPLCLGAPIPCPGSS